MEKYKNTGIVIATMPNDGYAFIENQAGESFFMHSSVLENMNFRQLKEGMIVRFNVWESPRGPKAIDVEAMTDEVKALDFRRSHFGILEGVVWNLVKFEDKPGYGHIKMDNQEIYFPEKALLNKSIDELKPGDKVEFCYGNDHNRANLKAIGVHVVGGAANDRD